ncbi:MAG: 2-oxoacid:acceptor oxidoreductase subunit alpha [Candidatus Hinthialibacter antarcticus]|nr:2-oxoacid:acceptor oxidoreductase subunit alpha [Candidatus Hinthialibacter antarcticus]
MSTAESLDPVNLNRKIQAIESATVRFAGDSGDGMQLMGSQFTTSSVIHGNDVATLPDFPAEIRAPAGTLAGVSGFQINFASQDIHTPGDGIDALFAMNPAAMKANLIELVDGGLLVVNSESFSKDSLEKAGYKENPLEDGSLSSYQVVAIPLTKLNRDSIEGLGLDRKSGDRCKNFFMLGLAFWVYNRPIESTTRWIEKKFAGKENLLEANTRALKAGYHYGETAELFTSSYKVDKADIKPGVYRKVTGNSAVVLGLVAASKLSDKPLFYASYPITPASDILHEIAAHKNHGATTFQAEDEIAAMCAVLGASFGGCLAVTGTSGPGLALKMEAIGLGVMTELPAVIVNVQRGGPSTGLPTKTEQSDLLQSIFGRNGESPVAIVAPATPADCFDMALEAARIALKFMTPVILLSDGYLANGAEPWRIPDVESLPKIEVNYTTEVNSEKGFQPYIRDERLGRPWAIPGTEGLQHRLGGLEKQHITGAVSYDPENHDFMVRLRQNKIDGIAEDIPPLQVNGKETGDLLVLGWGGTYGSITTAVDRARKAGKSVSSAHLRYLNPFPKNLGEVLSNFKNVLIPELNLGQLRMLIRSKFLVKAKGLNKIQGRPFQISEIQSAITKALEE